MVQRKETSQRPSNKEKCDIWYIYLATIIYKGPCKKEQWKGKKPMTVRDTSIHITEYTIHIASLNWDSGLTISWKEKIFEHIKLCNTAQKHSLDNLCFR